MPAMIEVDGLYKFFGAIKAVDGISFQVERGEVLGFLGPNGAGKSTTMKIITGFLEPDAGRAAICGLDVASHPIAAKRRFGYMPEGAPSYNEMTPKSFLGFIAGVRGFTGSEVEARVAKAAERTQLGDVMYQLIDTLSRGYKRRVGLASALLHDPEVLILDEPTDGLDPNQKHEVRSLIEEMAAEKAIIISTHILEEVDAVCTRAIIIARGRIVADGTPDALEARSERHMGVSVAGDHAVLEKILPEVRALEGVAAAELEPRGLFAWSGDGSDILEPVRGLAEGNGLPVGSVSLERGRLEDVFRDVTVGAAGRTGS